MKVLLFTLIIVTGIFPYLYSQDSLKIINAKFQTIVNLIDELEYYEQDIFVLQKKMRRERAYGNEEIVDSFGDEIKIVNVALHYYYNIYVVFNRGCLEYNEMEITKTYLVRLIDSNINELNIALEMDIKDSLYDLGVQIRKSFRKFKDIIYN